MYKKNFAIHFSLVYTTREKKGVRPHAARPWSFRFANGAKRETIEETTQNYEVKQTPFPHGLARSYDAIPADRTRRR